MYGILPYIYHKNQPNVGKQTIPGSYGIAYRSKYLVRMYSLNPIEPGDRLFFGVSIHTILTFGMTGGMSTIELEVIVTSYIPKDPGMS